MSDRLTEDDLKTIEDAIVYIRILRNALQVYGRRYHYHCEEDGWYSCPKSTEGCLDPDQDKDKCNCGADEHNAAVLKILQLEAFD